MSESQPAPQSSSGKNAGSASGQPRLEPLVIRPWPKIVLMLPTFFLAIICGLLMHFLKLPAENEFGLVHAVRYVRRPCRARR